jgi:hypothetical protein
MKFTYEGKKYEFRGEYHVPGKGDYFLNPEGGIRRGEGFHTSAWAIVHPVEKLHTFGPEGGPKVVFRETGEVREAHIGDWTLDEDFIEFVQWGITGTYTILEPVRVEKED